MTKTEWWPNRTLRKKNTFLQLEKNVLILCYLRKFKMAAHEYDVVAHLVW